MDIFKEDTSKSPGPLPEPKKKKKAPRKPRDLECCECGKMVKVSRYITDDDNYTCGECKNQEAKQNEINDKGSRK